MQTQCTRESMEFQPSGRRRVVGEFDGGSITTDGGVLLLREVEKATGIIQGFSRCLEDFRAPHLIRYTVEDLIAQRVYGLALGYEDLIDHEELRQDGALALAVGKDPPGRDAVSGESQETVPLAGKSTLNRMELVPADREGTDAYHKITYDMEAVDRYFVEMFLNSYDEAPEEIILDVDATDDPVHGKQEGRFFHGYYKAYCYLPLYIFCGDHLLYSRLRRANRDPAEGTVEALMTIVEHIREQWPEVRIILRGDSGFCREEIMAWCEAHGVCYVFGIAKNARLIQQIHKQMEQARRRYLCTTMPARRFRRFRYRTLTSWSRKRHVIGKAEYLPKGANPRFIVTSLPKERMSAQRLYEDLYCARGEMENRIKEQQLCLFADRTSTATMRANQMRLWLSGVAYTLLHTLRRVGLKGTKYARARCDTIRNKLLKIGGLISVSIRRIRFLLASGYPYAELFRTVLSNLRHTYAVLRI